MANWKAQGNSQRRRLGAPSSVHGNFAGHHTLQSPSIKAENIQEQQYGTRAYPTTREG